MNTFPAETIKKFAQELWPKADVEVLIGDKIVRIKVSQMYETPGLSFAQLQQLADLFNTRNINDDDRFYEGGCKTCDYGSVYGFTLSVRPE